MNSRNKITLLAAAVVVGLAAVSGALAQTPLGSGFTYQGKLDLLGTALDATADFEFTLWDAKFGPNMIGAVVPVNNVTVVDGQFTVEIDFGVIAFNGDKRWLEIAVRSPAGGGGFTTLDPRQPITAAPYALQTRGIFVDVDGKVGIGTTAPERSLHIVGDILQIERAGNSPGVILKNTLDGSIRAGWFLETTGPSTGRVILTDESLATRVITLRDGKMGVGTGAPANELTVAGDADFTGNVGIGEASPSAALDVVGTTELNGDVTINSNLTVHTDKFFVDGTSGKVGIGTNTPATKLDVVGTVTATAFVGDGSLLTGVSGDADADPANELQTLAEVLGQGNAAGGADMLDLGTVNADAFSSNLGALRLQTDGTTRIFADPTTGNVGIRNVNPNARLQVTGSSNFESTLLLNYVGEGAAFDYPPALKIDGGGYNSVGGAVTGIEVDLSGATATNKYAAVFNGGNVGIGTTTPAEALHVSGGNILADRGAVTALLSRSLLLGGARTASDNAYATIQFQNYDDNNGRSDYIGAEIRSHNEGNTDAGDLRFFVNDGSGGVPSEGMRIDRDGNVRFGPGLAFHVPADTDRTVIVRGKIKPGGNPASAQSTTGVTSGRFGDGESEGHYVVTFPSPVSEVPIVTVSGFDTAGGNERIPSLVVVTSAGFELRLRNHAGFKKDGSFNFIAIGER